MEIFGTGTAIVECLRIAKMIERHEERFLRRVYTPQEIQFCSARAFATQHYAAHWAAKEAIVKALKTSWRRTGITYQDLEVRYRPSENPKVAVAGEARQWCATHQISAIHLSLAHCRTHATAYAIAVKD